MEGTGKNGFTIIELVVAMALTSMLIAVVAMAFTGQSRSYNTQQDVVSLQQDLRSALQLIAKEIRMAGYDPTGNANAAIVTANATNLRFTQDIGGGVGGVSDGDTSDANEDVRYAISTSGALGRETGGAGGLQPVAENIDRLAFEYYMDNGTWTQAPAAADLDDIRAVKIMVLGHSDKQSAGAVDNSVFRPPVASGTAPIWTPATTGNFHWRMMSIIVQCRNIQIK